MDWLLVVVLVLVVTPIAVIWALSKAAALRGPAVRREARKPVEALVTDVIPDEHPDAEPDAARDFRIDSAPPNPGKPDRVEPYRPEER